MSTATRRDRRSDLVLWVKDAVASCGMALKESRLRALSVPMCHAREVARFSDFELSGSRSECKDAVAARIRTTVNDLKEALRVRGAEPEFGVEVETVEDLSELAEWDVSMGRYAVYLLWIGPKPATWPHKVTPEDTAKAAGLKDDDLGMISDYRNANPEGWDAALRVLQGGKALDDAAKEARAAPRLPRPTETA